MVQYGMWWVIEYEDGSVWPGMVIEYEDGSVWRGMVRV